MEAKRPFSDADWLATPEPVRRYIEHLEQVLGDHGRLLEQQRQRLEKIEARQNRDSQNSNKPPSSDSPFKKPEKTAKKSKRKKGGQKGHKGHRQELLEPTRVVPLKPESCPCGNHDWDPSGMEPFYVHQVIELPAIQLDVTHYVLHKGKCPKCGKPAKAPLPEAYCSGYGPRLCALIAEMSGIQGASRESVQEFLKSVLGISISIGAIQKVLDRTSKALKPVYEHIGRAARAAEVNHIDETSWFVTGKLHWLWAMVNATVAYFMIHSHRSKEAFLNLIGAWEGILVSDNYSVYRNWTKLRQTCLAHYIRRAKGLAERKDEALRRFGERALKELRLLCRWAKAPPSRGEWNAFYARFIHLVFSHETRQDDAGVFARLLIKEMDSLWVFLEENGVEPTNNRAERAIRFGVLWRKRSNGTQSEKGNRWVERILSLKQTCRSRSLPTFPKLVQAIDSYFKEQLPDLSWIGQ
ncbi:MAG: IS66 family transposase [Deltaproteobacteria bacterium]|nr:IS66 family transposase [Deltaproteobacteria bacterium]